MMAEKLSSATRQDPVLSKVHQFSRQGWLSSTDEDLKPYRIREQELSTQGQILLWGNRVVIPTKLRTGIMQELHRNHPGIVRMKALARSYLWLSGLDKDLESYIQKCETCQVVRNAPAPAPLHPWLWPSKPWQHIHVDFSGPVVGKMFLLVVDAHLKWPEIIEMNSITSTQTITEIRRLFATHGLPTQLVSDNGPQFTSEEFATFCKKNGVKHIRCSPYHPVSNGLYERLVQTFKKAMKASRGDERSLSHRLSSFLLQYRCTPHTTTNTPPCELFVGRSLRMHLDLLRSPTTADHVATKQDYQKQYHDRRARERKLEVGQAVMAKNFRPGPTWLPAVVTKQLGPLTFLVILRNGQQWKRHMDHLRRYEVQEQEGGEQQDEEVDLPVRHEPAPTPTEVTSGTAKQEWPVTPSEAKNTSEQEQPVTLPERKYPVRERHAPDRLM